MGNRARSITPDEWSQMSYGMRISAMQGMSRPYAARLYAEIKPSPGRGPRISIAEWRALGADGQDTLRDFLEPWEIAIVNGWDSQEKSSTPISAGRVCVCLILSYAVFCLVFAFVHGLKSAWYGQGFHCKVWQCVTVEVPGIVWSDLPVKRAARHYIDLEWMHDVEPSSPWTWRVVQLPDDGGWSIALKYKVLPPRGTGTEYAAHLTVTADHFGYFVR